MRQIVRLVVAILLSGLSAQAHSQELQCDVAKKYVCDIDECKSIAPKVWNKIDLEKEVYARCDSSGCSSYSAQFFKSGEFINIALPKKGVVAKIAISNNAFHESASLGHLVYLSFGICRLIK